MVTHPQTIQIFLPSGDPQGIRIASITTRIVQVIEIPRACLDSFLATPEAGAVGLYTLFGENDETDTPKAYIGQTGNLGTRLKQHNEKKDFWNRALVALSLTHSLTVTHAHYLEWLAISRATRARRFELENGTIGSRPHTPPAMESECREIFETLDILLTTLGYPLFDPLIRPRAEEATPFPIPRTITTQTTTPPDETERDFHCRATGVEGHARYTEEGLVVLAGSYGKSETSDSFLKHNYFRKRQALIDQNILKTDGPKIIFMQDTLFKSPSPAAVHLLGCAANGWDKWKDSSNRTLGEVMGRYQTTDDTGT